ncbi:MAG TPA: ATP-binding protein [Vicinamibacteria bacterium]|nr:ATP-binding protein [Vicinamibacteria bacterium]
MTSDDARTVRLDIASRLDMLDMVQTVLSHLAGVVGFDDESLHYMTVALRESVVNAIRHGNHADEKRRVAIEFVAGDRSLEVRVQDEGAGFDPASVPDPLAEANLLKPDGRGIFFMRSFMDVVEYSFPAGGGTRVRMVKRLP